MRIRAADSAGTEWAVEAVPADAPPRALRGPSHISPLPLRAYVEPLQWKAASRWSGLVLFAADVLGIAAVWQAASLVGAALRLTLAPSGFLAAGALWFGVRVVSGLYPGYGVSEPEDLRRSTTATVAAASAHLIFAAASGASLSAIAVVAATWLSLMLLGWTLRDYARATLVRLRMFGRPVVIVGGGRTGEHTIRELHANPAMGIVPVAVFDDDPVKHGTLVEGVPVLGSVSESLTWQPRFAVRAAIVAFAGGGTRVAELEQDLGNRYESVGVVSDLPGVANLWTRNTAIGAVSMLDVRHAQGTRVSRILKRALDLAAGIPLFIVSVPVVAVCAVLVKLASPHASPLYSQSRIGIGGRRIRMWKIRSMVPNADTALESYLQSNSRAREQWDRHMKLERDPRIIPFIGRFLRLSSLDELPQLWNVVTGDMSLVGPRPFPDYHLSRFNPEFRAFRSQVSPGITGYWQVTYRSASTLQQQQDTDSYYIRNWSIWLDLWILFRTARVVLSGKGAA